METGQEEQNQKQNNRDKKGQQKPRQYHLTHTGEVILLFLNLFDLTAEGVLIPDMRQTYRKLNISNCLCNTIFHKLF